MAGSLRLLRKASGATPGLCTTGVGQRQISRKASAPVPGAESWSKDRRRVYEEEGVSSNIY